MSLLPNALPPDDFLARAEAVLRETPVPSGPPEETMARTLAAIQAAANAPRIVPFLKRRRVQLIMKVSAAILILAGGLIGLGVFLRNGPPLAFAEVAQKFRDAHTLAYQLSVQSPMMKQTATMQLFLKEPSLVRMEGPVGQVSIYHVEQGQYKILSLNPIGKTAVLFSGKGTKAHLGEKDPMKMVDELRGLAEKEVGAAGNKQFGDVEAQGFRVQKGPVEWLVWADPKTRLPVQVEVTGPDGTRSTLSEFRFNPKLDDALFSLEVPKGYKLQPIELEDLTPEEHLVRMLRFYAGTAAGKFPKRLDDTIAFMLRLTKMDSGKPKEKASPEGMRLGISIVSAGMFVASLKGEYGYKPAGVKLGDTDKILFWYRPTGATKWRVLYADLHWADLTTDQLPKIPKP